MPKVTTDNEYVNKTATVAMGFARLATIQLRLYYFKLSNRFVHK